MNSFTLLLLATVAAAAPTGSTGSYAVLHFNNEPGNFSSEGRMDPIISPGVASGHSHGVMGGNKFGLTVEGDQLLSSTCTNALIKNDKSNYWAPDLWFQSPVNGSFKKVSMFYIFDASNDDIKAFPPGLKIVSGNPTLRTPPSSGTGALQLDPSMGEIQPVQWTCPTITDVDRYPPDSDGTTAGIVSPTDKGSGAGFPIVKCDGYGSPLRQNIHMPSCYNSVAGLDDYKNNMQFPTSNNGRLDCPSGWIHVPHLFIEIYYDTPSFSSSWTEDGKTQPFILSMGDCTGYGLHADFVAGWDVETLQTIIDGCDAGDAGMDKCPNIIGGLNTNDTCQIPSAVPNPTEEWITDLPGDNKPTGWGHG